MIKTGQWGKAESRLDDLCGLVEAESTEWLVPDGDINRPGYVVMRCDNLRFRIEQLRIAEGLLP
jgi:hypothetical protein